MVVFRTFAGFVIAMAVMFSRMAFAQGDYQFSDGGRPQTYQLSPSEVYVLKGSLVAPLQGYDLARLRKDSAARPSTAPAFYDRTQLPSSGRMALMSGPERARRLNAARRIMTGKLYVKMTPIRWKELTPTHPIAKEETDRRGWMMISYTDPVAALDATDWMVAQGAGSWEFIPQFLRPVN